jgi:hypothetical protein
VIPCAGSGQDGDLQKGLARSFTDNGDGTITDTQTGLVWEKLSDDGSIHDWNDTYTWAAAFTSKIAALNSATFAGHNDWRVPNVNELQSINNYGANNPSVDSVFNSGCVPACSSTLCSCTVPSQYWSSTNSQGTPSDAYVVVFDEGNVVAEIKSINYSVRAVRGGS